MKKIWISGASGMLGSHFRRLLDQKLIPFIANGQKEIDITQLDKVSDFVREQKITHIINCAAYTQVDRAETEETQAYLVNATGPYQLAVAAKCHGARVIHFSTDYVFDGKKRTPYSEKCVCNPLGIYGKSKLAGEKKLLEEHRESCIIRTSWLFGYPGKNFVNTILRLMGEKEQLRVVVDQIGRPTYCQDLAEVTLDLLDAEGIFHFANTFETSWFHFAQEICRQALELGYPSKFKIIEPIPSSEYPTPVKRPAYSTLCTKKIEDYLGRSPRPWQGALYDYLRKKR